jgi:hypothetical protein
VSTAAHFSPFLHVMLTCVTRLLLCYQTDRFDRSICMPQLITSSEIQGQIEQNKASNAPRHMPIYCAPESTYSTWRKTNLPVHSKFSGRCRLAIQSIQHIDHITSNELDKTGAARYPHLPAGPVSAASLASLSLPPDRVIRQVSTRAWVGKDSRFSAGERNDEIEGAKAVKQQRRRRRRRR